MTPHGLEWKRAIGRGFWERGPTMSDKDIADDVERIVVTAPTLRETAENICTAYCARFSGKTRQYSSIATLALGAAVDAAEPNEFSKFERRVGLIEDTFVRKGGVSSYTRVIIAQNPAKDEITGESTVADLVREMRKGARDL